MSATLRLAEQLISKPSVTPEDGGCTALISAQLEPLGFQCEVIDLGPDNFEFAIFGPKNRALRVKPWRLQAMSMWCPQAPFSNGQAIHLPLHTAMANCLGVAQVT